MVASLSIASVEGAILTERLKEITQEMDELRKWNTPSPTATKDSPKQGLQIPRILIHH